MSRTVVSAALAAAVGLGLIADGRPQHAATPAPRWLMRDLGTLGGRFSVALGVNEAGDVVGTSRTSDRQRHVFLWRGGRMTDLGAADRHTQVRINDRGQVVWDVGGRGFLWQNGVRLALDFVPTGLSESGQLLGRVVGSGYGREVVWQRGKMREIVPLPGDAYVRAADINAVGDVVGSSVGSDGPARAFLWRDGRLRDLGGLPGFTTSEAVAINDASQVIGYSSDYVVGDRVHAWVWRAGVIRDLGVLGGQWSYPSALNSHGQVIGHGVMAGSKVSRAQHGFLWDDGRMIDLRTLGGRETFVSALSDARQVVGSSNTKDGNMHAFIWRGGNMRDLGRQGAYSMSSASAISRSGRFIVGTTRIGEPGEMANYDPPHHAVLWTSATKPT